jgi:6-phospho-beta-glucosidase
MVFQDPFSSLNPAYRVSHGIMRGLEAAPPRSQKHGGSGTTEAERVVEAVGLAPAAEILHRFPYELSGGQRQRIGFAQALAYRPALILADEPVSMLDVSDPDRAAQPDGPAARGRGVSFLYITHDIASARYIADRVVIMYGGHIVESGPTEEVLADPKHPYTQLLLSAVPDPRAPLNLGPSGDVGEPPSVVDPSPGCRFRRRCPLAIEQCEHETPLTATSGRAAQPPATSRSRPRPRSEPSIRTLRHQEQEAHENRSDRRRLDLHTGADRRRRADVRRTAGRADRADGPGRRSAGRGRQPVRPADGQARARHQGAVDHDLDAAVDGASAVLLQLRIGGQAARHGDESWPQECGCIGQETTGAGGLAKALRTVPVVLDIAQRVRERALESAWIVDFTNPVGIVTRALLDEGHRAVGLCNVAIGFQRRFARALGVEPERISLDHVGLNHLTWERAVLLDGVDVLPRVLDEQGEELAKDTGIPLDLMRRLGVVPSYYLRYFYRHDAVLETQRTDPQTRAEKVIDLERDLLARYADPQWEYDPSLLEQRGGAHYSDAALRLVASLINDTGDVQVVNVSNRGTLPFLPDEAVIEVPARVDADGVHAQPLSPVDNLYRGLIAHVAAYEELAVDAALRGGRQRVFDACSPIRSSARPTSPTA